MIYSGRDRKLLSRRLIVDLSASGSEERDREKVALRFLTPARLKYQGDLVGPKVEFSVLVKSLLRRVSALSAIHCGREMEVDFQGIIRRAEGVKIGESRLFWEQLSRYSGRQDARLSLSGFRGSVTYEGPVGEFLPLLRAGELCHVGKGAVFGLGMFRIVDDNEQPKPTWPTRLGRPQA